MLTDVQRKALDPPWHEAPWVQTADGRVIAVRPAAFWHPVDGGRVQCSLCYRACLLGEGETGTCGYRRNEGGEMQLLHHGEASIVWPVRLGYNLHGLSTYCPGALALMVGSVGCCSRCSFCHTGMPLRPADEIPWAAGSPGKPYPGKAFAMARAMVHPREVVEMAKRQSCSHVMVTHNEPLTSFEWTLDVLRASREAGLKTIVFTNGLSGAGPVRALAGLVDAVNVGVKGNLSPAFYEKYMGCPPGAVEAAKAAARAWTEIGSYVVISNIVPPFQMMDDRQESPSLEAFFTWVREDLGSLTVVELGDMLDADTGRRLVDGGTLGELAYGLSILRVQRIGQEEAGLRYVWRPSLEPLLCHNCGARLLEFRSPMLSCKPCLADLGRYCHLWDHAQHATGGRCDGCGADVPVVTLKNDYLDMLRTRLPEINRAAPPATRTPVR